MGGEDNGRNLDELARRMEAQAQKLEALERENRELREAVGASERELETPQQQPQAKEEMTVGSSKTVRGLLLGPRDDQAYSRPFVGVLPPYAVGWLLTCAFAAYGAYIAFWAKVGPHTVGSNWLALAPLAALFFGVYGGVRDGSKFVFARFHYVGLLTAIGTSVVVFLVSFGIAHWFWAPEEYRDTGFVLAELITDDLNPFPIGAVFVSTWMLFVSGALLGTALQFWASEKEQVEVEGSTEGSGEGRSSSASVVRAQAWLGFAGTVLAALIALIGTLVGGQ